MHKAVQNLIYIQNEVKSILNNKDNSKLPRIIAVSKTFELDKILPLINHGHLDFGENKVQEAVKKWTDIKNKKPEIQLHMIGKLQSNKVKFAVKLFDYIHSVDNEKLAKKIAEEQLKLKKKIKIFIQINVGNESQKSGIDPNNVGNFLNYCKNLNLNVIGLMCIPPESTDSKVFFEQMKELAKKYNQNELSMGMSSDYLKAAQLNSTYIRIGSSIFGQRN
tara:strand:- start:282 stop:941 length:660 start_codon:yes stop_codon:yes gene_type:complete